MFHTLASRYSLDGKIYGLYPEHFLFRALIRKPVYAANTIPAAINNL